MVAVAAMMPMDVPLILLAQLKGMIMNPGLPGMTMNWLDIFLIKGIMVPVPIQDSCENC